MSTVYTLTKTMRYKIFNHREFIKALVTKNILNNMNLSCNCTTSPFLDPNHGHIVTGDIHIVQNNKLGKLLCKGPKYREPGSINFSNCKTAFCKIALQNFLLIGAIKRESLSNALHNR